MMRRSLAGFLLALALAVAAPEEDARATTLAPLTVEQMTDAATYIVRGRIESVWTELDDEGIIWTRALVDVSEVRKGPDTPDSVVVDSPGGRLGAQRTVMPSSARFSEGEDLLLFLADIDHGRRLTPVGMFLGKYTVRRAPGATRHHVVRYNRTDEAFDHRFLAHPPEEERVYLDEVLDRVETRLDGGWGGEPVPGIAPEKLREINTPERRFRR